MKKIYREAKRAYYWLSGLFPYFYFRLNMLGCDIGSSIRVGRHCFFRGRKRTQIGDKARFGNKCFIAANAVVVKDVPSNSLVGGVPAKIIKKLN